MKKFNLFLLAFLFSSLTFAQTISDFEKFFSNVADFENNALPPDSFWNGSDLSGGFTSGGYTFGNSYDTTYNSWSGFSYSNTTNDTAGGVGNQYSAITAGGFNAQTTYAIGTTYGDARVVLNGSKQLGGLYATNSAYAFLSMKNGDMFAKKFGDSTGTAPDWFKLTVKGWHNGAPTANAVDFYLADYRSPNSADDYIVNKWSWVDLQPLGLVDSIEFTLSSSDTGAFGMNTPAYFCIDNVTELVAVDTFWNGIDLTGGFADGAGYFVNSYDTTYDIWSGFAYSNKTDDTTAGILNQYSAITAKGVNNSSVYAVGNNYGPTKLKLTGNAAGKVTDGFYVTNSTYAYLSMKNGDQFAKKFGGPSGNDPDWFMLSIQGWHNGTLKPNRVDFLLADYSSSNNANDYLINDWQWVDLKILGNVDSLSFVLTSSDTGQFGMNTPAYFCIDNFTTLNEANVAPVAADDLLTINYLQDTIIDVLANDVDATFTPLTVTLLDSSNVPGTLVWVDSLNKIHYRPAVSSITKDTLIYAVCDVAGDCATAYVIINITGVTGLGDLAANAITVFPNPFNQFINIRTNGDVSLAQLFDVNGRIVSEVTNASTSNLIEINTSEIATGMYMLKLVSANGIVVKKLLKQ